MESGKDPNMRLPTLAAAALMAGTTLLHVIGGGAEFHVPLQNALLDPLLRAIAAVLWHFVTVMLALQTAALLWLSRHPEPGLAILLVAIQIGFATLFLFYGQIILGSVWILGQWTIFLALAVLIFLGGTGYESGARAFPGGPQAISHARP
jgi:hypothetical protein